MHSNRGIKRNLFPPFSVLKLSFLFLLSLSLNCGKGWAGVNDVKPTARMEIDRVDILGVTAFSSDIIQNSLELGTGDLLVQRKVIRTEENLLSLYHSHGYKNAQISSRLVRKRGLNENLETTLEFSISEGDPIRISEVEFTPSDPQDEATARFLKKNLPRLKRNFGLSEGSVFDQDKVSEGKQVLQELLIADDYIGAKLTHIQVKPHRPSQEVTLDSKLGSASQWVRLVIGVDLGEKVRFGFRGNTVFTSGYLDGLIDDQRLLGLGKDYVRAVMNRLIEEYHSSGYALVEVTPYTIEVPAQKERKVTYLINEGPRVRIDSIDFDGNLSFSSDELRKQFFLKASSLVQHNVYVEKDVQKAAELILEWIREKGYLSARLVTQNSAYLGQSKTHPEVRSVKLSIYLYEGSQTIVRNIDISGARALTPNELSKLLAVKVDQPLNLFILGEGIETIKKAYRERGYLDFKITNEGTDSVVQYSHDNTVAAISLLFNEGYQFKVSHVGIEGAAKTKEEVIRRELKFKEGAIISESQLIQSELQLKRLGIFSTVTVRTIDDPHRPDYKVIWVNVREADRGILTWGPGIRNDLGIRLFSQLAYTNLWGKNHTVSFSLNANRRFYLYNFVEAQAQLAYAWPWFLGLPGITFRPTVQYAKTQYFNFAANNLTLSAAWEKQLASQPNLLGNLSYTLERINQFNAVLERDNSQLRIGTISPRLSLDLRDNPLAPRSGIYSTAWLDLSLPLVGSQSDLGYYRAQFRADAHWPVWKDIGFYFSFRTGYEQSFTESDGSADAIPLIKQFALGGIGSLRGYQELEFSKPQTLLMKRSLAYANYRTQLDFPIAGSLKFGPFVDAANLSVDSYSFGNLRYGTGFGFHYLTPLGAVNFDIGFKVDPPPGADKYVTHFSIGII